LLNGNFVASSMRILHCIQGMAGGGAERQLSYLAPAQAQAGDDVHVALVDDGVNSPRLRSGRVTVHRLESRGTHDPLALVRLDRLADRVKPDVIQTWLTRFDILGGLVAIRRGIPWIISERTSAPFYPPTVKNRIRVRLGRRAAAIIANSEEGADYWRNHVRASAMFVVPNAIPIQVVDAEPPADLRHGWASADSPLIMVAGRLSTDKNVGVLLDAVILALLQRPAVALFAGDGPERAELEKRVADAGLENRIRFAGYLTQLWAGLKSASVMISASLAEGHPNVVTEALACRCPMVLSDIPIHRRLTNGVAALYAPAHSPQALAAALVEVLDDPASARAR
jgi:glycosyltransferase involved in cell wall biosynthesis